MNLTRLKIPTIVLAVVALVVGVSGGAVAAKLITGKDVKDGSLTSKDIKNGTIATNDLKNGAVAKSKMKDQAVTSAKIKDGTVGANDLSSAAKNSLKATYAGPNWSIVDRNVQGDADAFLRAGPSVTLAGGNIANPPLGIGSLGIRTAGGSDKAAFGNQVDFAGMPFSDVTAVGYSVFATGEDVAPPGASLTNLPSISFELDFNPGGALEFHTLFYQPSITVGDVNRWTPEDAVADTTAHWGLSNAAGTPCDQNGSLCTFAQLQDYLATNEPDAQILTVQVTKGSGQPPFSGAVDALQINNDIYDFEPFGVSITHP